MTAGFTAANLKQRTERVPWHLKPVLGLECSSNVDSGCYCSQGLWFVGIGRVSRWIAPPME